MSTTHGNVKLYTVTLDQEQFAIIALYPARLLHNMHIGMQSIKNPRVAQLQSRYFVGRRVTVFVRF